MLRTTARAVAALATCAATRITLLRPMATETAPLTHCPTCGVKLHRTDLSLCAYCASPLRLGASAQVTDDETARLLAKLTQHANYEGALRWTPIESATEVRIARWRGFGALAIVLALLAIVISALRADASFWRRTPTLIAAVLAVLGVLLLAAGALTHRAALAKPMLRRAARVLDRRSRTELVDRVGSTNYYFQLRFADGSEGEFHFVGRGTMYEPPTVGATGVAYTRGAEMIEFRRL